MSEREIRQLVADGTLRSVKADEETARVELETARQHVASAALLADSDPNAAFQLGYDAARKAIAAHMRAHGYRPGSGQGAHAKTGRYAAAMLGGSSLEPHIDAFDDLRTLRNQSEYDALLLDESDVLDALDHVRAIVDAVGHDLE